MIQKLLLFSVWKRPHPFVDNVAGDYRGQQASQVGQAVGQAHQYSGEPRRYVQMVDFKTRVNRAVQTDAHGQYEDRQVRVAARVGRGDQRYRRTKLTWKQTWTKETNY